MEDETLAAPPQQASVAFVTRFFLILEKTRKLLIRFWWIPVITVIASVFIQSYLLKHVRPVFVSAGRMIVNVKVIMPAGNVYAEGDVANFLGTQMTLMESATVGDRARARIRSNQPDIQVSPVDVTVALSPKASVFNLHATGDDPRYTQAYLQAIMEEYVKLKKDMLQSVATTFESSLREELKQLAVDVQKSREDLTNFESINPVVFLQAPGENSAAQDLSRLTRELDERKSQLHLLQSLTLDQNLERLQNGGDQAATMIKRDVATDRNSTNAGYGSMLTSIPSNLGDFEAAYVEAKQQLKMMNVHRAEVVKEVGTNARALPELDKEIAHQQILLEGFKKDSEEQMKNRQRTLEVQIQNLEEMVAAKKIEAVDVSQKLSTYNSLKETSRRLQNQYDQMQGSLQRLEADKDIGQESVTIMEPASTADVVPAQETKHLMMSGLIGLLLGVGIIVFIDRLDDRPSSFAELEKLFNLPVLGQFPLMKPESKQLDVPILQVNDTRYPMVEAYRSLRSALLYKDSPSADPRDQPRSIVITSARPHDGKSMVSCNFAVTLAQTGSRVLLIDADLHRGVLHKHFAVPPTPGLADVLVGRTHWSTAVVQTSIPNLHILPCGEAPRLPGHLFASTGKFLSEVAGHYDYYLFDTAPVMVGDDVLSLAPQVDGLIMVVRAKFTSGRIAQAALNLLQLRRVNVIGLVFNAVNPKSSDYYHYKFKDYYPHAPTDN